jgi:hypothetical protein
MPSNKNKAIAVCRSDVRRAILASMVAMLWCSIGMGQTASSNTNSGESAKSSASVPTAKSHDREITGRGNNGSIPVFTSPTALGASVLFQSPLGYVGLGTSTPETTFRVVNNEDSINQFNLTPIGIYSTVTSSIDNSTAIRGDFLATSGFGYGVEGLTFSHDGYGVAGSTLASGAAGFGVAGAYLSATGGGGGGVLGTTVATTDFTAAVRGNANGTSGGSVAIFGEQFSPDAGAGLFINRANGPLLIGASGPAATNVFRVDGTGRVFADGGFEPDGADFAESMTVVGDVQKYEPGDLLEIDARGHRRLELSQQAYSPLVAGIYSTKPGMLGSTRKFDAANAIDEVPLAVVGIVPCKVTTENGPIKAGDLLVTSSLPGRAMKGTDRSKMLGAIVGKALDPLQEGTGVIQVLVTLQ